MHNMSGHSSIKAIIYALLANFGIALGKTGAAIITSSGSMLAEAIHSYADCTNQGLLFLGLRKAKKKPTQDHPLGFGKEIYFWSFIVAILLFSIGGMFSIYEGIHKIQHPEPISRASIAIGVLVIAVVLESFSLYGAIKVIRSKVGKLSLWKFFKTSRESELIVVLAEDIAALLGLVFALLAVIATVITKNPVYDAIGSLFIGIILIIVAVAVGYIVKSLLIGRSAEEKDRDKIELFIKSRPQVSKLFNLITQHYGQDLMVAAKVKMKEKKNAKKVINDVNVLEKALKKKFPIVKFSFFEVDDKD